MIADNTAKLTVVCAGHLSVKGSNRLPRGAGVVQGELMNMQIGKNNINHTTLVPSGCDRDADQD